jgi:ligand-binding sensor domain-containing protein
MALLLAVLYANTARVSGVAVSDGVLWAATSAGVEQYDLRDGARLRLFTTEDGLDSNEVLRIRHDDGVLRVRTMRSECSLTAAAGFACARAPAIDPEPPALVRRSHGARETARLRAGGREIVATDGAGLWLDGRRITARGQICGNHVEALASFRGSLWVGTFDEGLCVLQGGRFRSIATPFRMVNDLRATAEGLWIAAGEGLFFTGDGRRFRREARVRERGVNRLATSGARLFATTPVALYAIDGRRVRRWPHPAGSTALQAVAVSGANLWLASEDLGVIRLRGGRFEAFDRASGLPSSWVVDVAPARQSGVWAATLRDGAVRLGADGRVEERRDPHAWGLRLYQDQGRILFGSQQGVAGRDLPLPDPRVHALLRTGQGLWVGTEGGLWREPALPAAELSAGCHAP